MKRCEEMKIVVEITLLREDLYFFFKLVSNGPSSSIYTPSLSEPGSIYT